MQIQDFTSLSTPKVVKEEVKKKQQPSNMSGAAEALLGVRGIISPCPGPLQKCAGYSTRLLACLFQRML